MILPNTFFNNYILICCAIIVVFIITYCQYYIGKLYYLAKLINYRYVYKKKFKFYIKKDTIQLAKDI